MKHDSISRSRVRAMLQRAAAIGAGVIMATSGDATAENKAAPEPSVVDRHRRLLEIQRSDPAPALGSSPGTDAPRGVTAEDVTFDSKTLARPMRYRALLPASYSHSHRYYPVLYLLHGYMNPYYEWDKQTSLSRLIEREGYELIVVLPQFDNSFYVNAANNPKDAYMSYFFSDLLAHVEGRYRARSEPPARALGGVSMGGFGAVLWGLRAPRAFSFIASFGGSIELVRRGDEYAGFLAPFDLERVIGAPANTAARRAIDPLQILETVDVATLPPFWLHCGTDDGLSEQTLEFAKRAIEKKLRFTLRLTPGGHEWVVWDAVLPEMLEELAEVMGVERRPPS